jgi:PPOX class probable FMN-dependent enzyme
VATISTETHVREILGSPSDLVVAKVADHLTPLTRQFVDRSPFVCVATSRPDGGLDISPRGDPAGFVRILDDRRLLIPERPGNRLGDTLTNLLADPRIALLSLIPGIGDTFRVNGRAAVVDDPELLAPSAVDGRAPRHTERSELPTSGAIMREVADAGLDAETYDRERDARYARREGLY